MDRVLRLQLLLLAAALAAQAQITGRVASEEISRLNHIRDESFVANGVDTATGGFSTSAAVVSFDGATTVEFSAHYDSIQIPSGIVSRRRLLGLGWTHPYAARLEGNPDIELTVFWDDNRRNTFRNTGPDQWEGLGESVRYDRLTRVSNVRDCMQCVWRVVRHDGTTYYFDDTGRLLRLANKIDQRVEITYNPDNTISQIREPITDKELSFTYNDSLRIRYITDPAARRTYFLYNGDGRLRALNFPARLGSNFGEAFVPMDIPDNNPSGLFQTINVSTTDPTGLIVLDDTNIGHQDPSQLQVFLISPAGTRVEISALGSRPSATSLDFEGVAIDAFHGENPQGDWTLNVVDTTPGGTGRLNGWSFYSTERTYPIYFNYALEVLVSSNDVDGMPFWENVYDTRGRVIEQFDGRVDTPPVTFSYEEFAAGVVTTITDRLGNTSTFEHDLSYHLTRFVDPAEAETLYTYDQDGDRTSITDALGRATTLTYDPNGNVATVTDPALFTTTLNYDSQNNLTRFTDALGNTSSFQYNRNNVTTITDAEGNRDQKTYNSAGQLTSNMLQDGAGVDYTYEGGMPKSAKRRGSGSRTLGRDSAEEEADYDELGRATRLEDAEGGERFIEYDNRGLVIRQTDPLDNDEFFEYDNRGRRIAATDKRGNTTRMQYDGNGNLIGRTNALGESITLTYDAEDRLVAATDALGNESTREYDAASRLVRTTDPLGNTLRYEYDLAGNPIAVYDALDRKLSEVLYDERDLPISVKDATGETVETAYDALQRPVTLTDPVGRTTRFTYDDNGRVTQVRAPGGRTASQSYLSDDVVNVVTDAAGDETRFSYDDYNRVSRTQPAAGRVSAIEYEYDESGRLISEDLPGNRSRNFTYDEAGRLTQIEYDGDFALPTVRFAYDQNGNRRVVSTVDGGNETPQVTRGFDALNRVTSFTDAHGDTITYDYDANGNLTRLGYPGAGDVRYTYDAANRLVGVRDWANRDTTFTYDENSRLIRVDYPNNTARIMEYDTAGRLTKRRDIALPAQLIVEYEFQYDRVGQLVTTQGGLQSARFMPAAMRTTYRADGRISSINGVDIGYDAEMNVISGPINGVLGSFQYDTNNNLINANGLTRRYDAEDRLIAWNDGNGESRFTVSPHSAALTQILQKRDASGTRTRYVYGVGLMYEDVGGSIRVLHYDPQGNAVAYTGGNGNVIGTVAYGPFGEIFSTTGTVDSIFRYGALFGILTDSHGLNYMRHRWYSPEFKRFLTLDPQFGDIGNPATLNRYIYAGNNPINFIDPDGEFLRVLVGAAVGAVVNIAATLIVNAVTGEETSWGDVLNAGLSGAIVGGGIALCGPPCAAGGAKVLAGIAALSAAAGAAGNVAGQGLDIALGNQDKFSFASLGTQVVLDGAFGAIPFGKGGKGAARVLGRGARRAARKGSRSSTTKILRATVDVPSPSGGSIPIPGPDFAVKRTVAKNLGPGGVVPIAAVEVVEDTLAKKAARFVGETAMAVGQGFVQTGVDNALGIDPREDSDDGSDTDANAARRRGRREITSGRTGRYGEFLHWSFYQAAHVLAGKPLPNNPNRPLAQF